MTPQPHPDPEAEVRAAEARLGRFPAYVRERFRDLLARGEPIPPLPGEACFREADWHEHWEPADG